MNHVCSLSRRVNASKYFICDIGVVCIYGFSEKCVKRKECSKLSRGSVKSDVNICVVIELILKFSVSCFSFIRLFKK